MVRSVRREMPSMQEPSLASQGARFALPLDAGYRRRLSLRAQRETVQRSWGDAKVSLDPCGHEDQDAIRDGEFSARERYDRAERIREMD